MDTTDVKIINLLSENSRMNASEISDKIKLSVSAVIERMKKLESNGIIKKYTVVLDDAAMGKDVSALMSVSLDNPGYNAEFESKVLSNPHITECHYMAGDFDYMLKIVTLNTKSLERVLNEIKCVPGVAKTKTMIVLSTVKYSLSAPLKSIKKI